MPFLVAKLARGQTGHALEVLAEEELVGVAGLAGDLFDGIIRFRQPALGLVDALAP